jgi:hypothetical protein
MTALAKTLNQGSRGKTVEAHNKKQQQKDHCRTKSSTREQIEHQGTSTTANTPVAKFIVPEWGI